MWWVCLRVRTWWCRIRAHIAPRTLGWFHLGYKLSVGQVCGGYVSGYGPGGPEDALILRHAHGDGSSWVGGYKLSVGRVCGGYVSGYRPGGAEDPLILRHAHGYESSKGIAGYVVGMSQGTDLVVPKTRSYCAMQTGMVPRMTSGCSCSRSIIRFTRSSCQIELAALRETRVVQSLRTSHSEACRDKLNTPPLNTNSAIELPTVQHKLRSKATLCQK